ncbi:hypothetical protein GCK32_001982 [Trichostrongylus colubriformis]|uniref:Dynein heavy chain C-terminal domain-containing protein n=1 Tax=Trichostrongylus colubriformis TaxID=6319 RepID=A0AAN8F6C0_TRICO
MAEMMSLEFVHAIKLVQKIHASLSLVNKTIRGTVTPDKTTLEVIKSLQLHQTPDTWQDLWSGPRDPAEYLASLIYKAKSVQELVSKPDENDFRKTPVDFSKLFRPGRLLNALRQVTARSSGCTMDMLQLSSAWDTSLNANDISIKVQGSPTQYRENESVAVPLYTDVTRSEYIATIMMPCTDVHKWNIAAVALFLK